MEKKPTLLLRNATIVNTTPGGTFDITPNASIDIRNGRIAAFGNKSAKASDQAGLEVIDLGGRVVTSGLIDCHTHLIYGGSRVEDFEARLKGKTYREIATSGGGISSTVQATRLASTATLTKDAHARLARMAAAGVTTVEIKSGYGLDLATEEKMLRVARSLSGTSGVEIRTTFLGAHALAPEFSGDKKGYLKYASWVMMPELARLGLIDMVDAFCEGVAFDAKELGGYFDAASRLGLPIKAHLDQLSDNSAAAMLVGYKALSVDHLEHLSDASIGALSGSQVVAVVLPGAYYFLGDTTPPPIAKLRAAGVRIALATDHNPGTSPLESILLAMNMACILFGLSPAEALRGTTTHAAAALGLGDRGEIAIAKRADLAIWEITHPAELSYHIGMSPLWARVCEGDFIHANIS